jgi:hypothetical protein
MTINVQLDLFPWVREVRETFDAIRKRVSGREPNLEFYALYGIVEGIELGTITRGNSSYRELAAKAMVDGEPPTCLEQPLLELGRNGLFISGFLADRNPTPTLTPEDELPARYRHSIMPTHWALAIESTLVKSAGENSETFVARGAVYSILRGHTTHGDPELGKFILRALHNMDLHDSHIHNQDAARCVGRGGLLGDELLLGCEPEKQTAVDRLKGR